MDFILKTFRFSDFYLFVMAHFSSLKFATLAMAMLENLCLEYIWMLKKKIYYTPTTRGKMRLFILYH